MESGLWRLQHGRGTRATLPLSAACTQRVLLFCDHVLPLYEPLSAACAQRVWVTRTAKYAHDSAAVTGLHAECGTHAECAG